jgi:2,3-diketo-5-methylthio-1-phosphopentane phosphatase
MYSIVRRPKVKKFIFICDFDGTISKEDFYKKMMRKYMPEKEITRYVDFKSGKIQDIIFLNEIFNDVNLEEHLLDEDVLNLPLDDDFQNLIKEVHRLGGDFIVLSAGCEYYIKKIFEHHGIKDIAVYSNEGVYKEKGLYITPNTKSPFYSERYGIDKEKVVKHFKEQYDFLFYAGDSGPDFLASLHADVRFGKDELIKLYNKDSVTHIPFTCFSEIIPLLQTCLKI